MSAPKTLQSRVKIVTFITERAVENDIFMWMSLG